MKLEDLDKHDSKRYRVLDLENGEYLWSGGPRSGCHLWFNIKWIPQEDWSSYELIEDGG